jgi:hypothetical protein
MEKADLDKLERRKDVIDMMVSMHSELSSIYKKNITILDVLLVTLSIILLTFVFADQYLLTKFKITEVVFKLILGLSTIFLTFLSLLSYIIDWRGKKICHDQAFKILIELKNEWRIIFINKESINYENVTKLEEKTALVLNQCISIDDKLFNRLKKKHYMKVALSSAISDNPNLPLFLLKFNLVKDAFLKSREESHEANK